MSCLDATRLRGALFIACQSSYRALLLSTQSRLGLGSLMLRDDNYFQYGYDSAFTSGERSPISSV
jgi:hypothetical protein